MTFIEFLVEIFIIARDQPECVGSGENMIGRKENNKFSDISYYSSFKYPLNHVITRMKNDLDLPFVIYVKNLTHGYSGGTCYNDGDNDPFHEDPTKFSKFELFDAVIDNFLPEISYRDFKLLCKDILKETVESDYGYYGNCSHYKVEYVDLKDLYDYLVIQNVITNEQT